MITSGNLIISEGFSGLKGVEYITKCFTERSSEFDLAFVDMNMPLMDGI